MKEGKIDTIYFSLTFLWKLFSGPYDSMVSRTFSRSLCFQAWLCSCHAKRFHNPFKCNLLPISRIKRMERKPDQMLFGFEKFSSIKIRVLRISRKRQCVTVQFNYFYKPPCIRLWARDFYEVIVDLAFGLINYHLIESLYFTYSVFWKKLTAFSVFYFLSTQDLFRPM